MTILIATFLTATAEGVFDAWTDRDLILQWWGDAETYRTVGWQSELVPGGTWKAVFEGPGGGRFSACGEYGEMRRPHALEWTWRAEWSPETTDRIRMTFSPSADGCLLSLACDGYRSAAEKAQQEAGWRQVMGWLVTFLTGAKSAHAE